jgi:hypothetical protein
MSSSTAAKRGVQSYRRVLRIAMREFKRRYPERKFFDLKPLVSPFDETYSPDFTYRWYHNGMVTFSTGKGFPLQSIILEARKATKLGRYYVNEDRIERILKEHKVGHVRQWLRYPNDNMDVFAEKIDA